MDKKNLLEGFAQYGQAHMLQRRNLMLRRSQRLFRRSIYGGIIYNVKDMDSYLQFINEDDPTVLKAKQLIKAGKTWPKK